MSAFVSVEQFTIDDVACYASKIGRCDFTQPKSTWTERESNIYQTLEKWTEEVHCKSRVKIEYMGGTVISQVDPNTDDGHAKLVAIFVKDYLRDSYVPTYFRDGFADFVKSCGFGDDLFKMPCIDYKLACIFPQMTKNLVSEARKKLGDCQFLVFNKATSTVTEVTTANPDFNADDYPQFANCVWVRVESFTHKTIANDRCAPRDKFVVCDLVSRKAHRFCTAAGKIENELDMYETFKRQQKSATFKFTNDCVWMHVKHYVNADIDSNIGDVRHVTTWCKTDHITTTRFTILPQNATREWFETTLRSLFQLPLATDGKPHWHLTEDRRFNYGQHRWAYTLPIPEQMFNALTAQLPLCRECTPRVDIVCLKCWRNSDVCKGC